MTELQHERRTFLVVDDEPDILDSIQRLFRKQYRVLTARTVDEALALLESEEIQVVMTDQRMPRKSGVEFLAELRKLYPGIVRVLLTGYSNIDHVIDAINEGHVYRYISKPWNPAELKLFVAQAFEYYESRRERELLVEELREINEKLEDRNIALSEANEELKILDRMKNVFMEVVSHELNTPIAVITGYEFLLRREIEDEDEASSAVTIKALKGIGTSARRLKDISARIFKMLTTDAAKAALNLESFPVSELMEDLNANVEPFLEKRGQTLAIDLGDAPGELLADREKLVDILVNLTVNAIKFSYDGATIDLSMRLDADDSDMIILSVHDEGIGVSEEDIEQIFAPFFSTFSSQYHSSGDFEFGKRGIGLGLTVARRFTEMHGGKIEVVSAEGEGATFTVHLPRRPVQFDTSSDELDALRH